MKENPNKLCCVSIWNRTRKWGFGNRRILHVLPFKCITDIGLGHPDAVYIRLGLALGPDPIDAAETLAYNVGIYECLTNEEKKAFTVSLWTGLDRHAAATGSDIIALLSESEAACVRDGLSEEQYATLLGTTNLEPICLRLDAFAVMTASDICGWE